MINKTRKQQLVLKNNNGKNNLTEQCHVFCTWHSTCWVLFRAQTGPVRIKLKKYLLTPYNIISTTFYSSNVCTQIFSVIEKLKDIRGDSYGNTRFSYWLWDSEKAYFSNWKWCRPCNRIQPTVTQANCCLSLNPKLLRFYFKVKFVFQKIGNTVTCKKDFSGIYAQFLHNVFQRIHNGSQFLLINNFFGGVLYKLQYC